MTVPKTPQTRPQLTSPLPPSFPLPSDKQKQNFFLCPNFFLPAKCLLARPPKKKHEAHAAVFFVWPEQIVTSHVFAIEQMVVLPVILYIMKLLAVGLRLATLTVEMLAQFIFLRILRRALDSQKFDMS